MGSVGDAYDNAMAESFFTHLNVSYLIGVASRRTLNFALGEAVRSACAAGASQSWRSPDAIGVPGRSVCPTIGVE